MEESIIFGRLYKSAVGRVVMPISTDIPYYSIRCLVSEDGLTESISEQELLHEWELIRIG